MKLVQAWCNWRLFTCKLQSVDVFDKVDELFQIIKMEYKFLDREKELIEVKYTTLTNEGLWSSKGCLKGVKDWMSGGDGES